jgi:signal transduction histidine kinase
MLANGCSSFTFFSGSTAGPPACDTVPPCASAVSLNFILTSLGQHGSAISGAASERFSMTKRLSISLLLQAVTGLMAIALVGGFAIVAGVAYERWQTAERVLVAADVSRDLFMAMQNLMVERGTVNTALAIPQPIDAVTAGTVTALRGQSERALNSALAKLTRANLVGTGPAIAAIRASHDRFTELRRQADAAVLQPLDERLRTLSGAWVADGGKLVDSINALSDVLSSDVVNADSFIAEMMKIKQLAWTMRDAAGLDRLLIGAAVVKQSLPPEIRQQLVELGGRVDAAWKLIEDDARLLSLPPALNDAIATARHLYFGTVRANHKLIVDALTAGAPAGAAGAQWIAIPNNDLVPLINVANTAFDLTTNRARTDADAAQYYLVLAVALTLFFVGFGLFATGLVNRRVVRPMTTITGAVRSVAAGALETAIPFEQRNDELGDLARALAVFRDNARAKQRMESELIQSERLSAIGQVTATVAHELRNPLSAIRNTLFTVREALGAERGDLDRPLGRMERSIVRCDRIINDLLDYTRAQDVRRRALNADAWVSETLAELSLPPDIIVTRDLGAPDCRVSFDAERMQRVLVNLIDNAVQAMSDRPAPRRIAVASAIDGEAYRLSIADSGAGIAPDILPRIFEPLFSTKPFGTGLGLPTVKQIVEHHGGEIAIDSAPGQGTRVVIRLPGIVREQRADDQAA